LVGYLLFSPIYIVQVLALIIFTCYFFN